MTDVTIYEVGPRDGLQNESAEVEVTSFVSPTWVPQLADAAEVVAAVGTNFPVLVPNERGLDRALELG